MPACMKRVLRGLKSQFYRANFTHIFCTKNIETEKSVPKHDSGNGEWSGAQVPIVHRRCVSINYWSVFDFCYESHLQQIIVGQAFRLGSL